MGTGWKNLVPYKMLNISCSFCKWKGKNKDLVAGDIVNGTVEPWRKTRTYLCPSCKELIVKSYLSIDIDNLVL